MKNFFKLLAVTLIFITLSCTSDESEIIEPPVIIKPPEVVKPPAKPVVPISSLMKPAIRNIATSATSRSNETRKLIVTSNTYANNRVNTNYVYKLNNMTLTQYIALPTDNLYDVKEDSLNAATEIEFTKTYTHNSAQQLTSIKTKFILHSDNSYPDEFFTYTIDGKLEHITAAYYGTYTYNSNGLISSKLGTNNLVEFTYEYDDQKRIINSYHWSSTPNGLEKDFHYAYSYPDVNFYTKTWYSVNTLAGTETRVDKVIYQYDITKPGIYNKEPVYQLENQYLHIVKISKESNSGLIEWSVYPKYFYDSEGYLMKYDGVGLNRTSDITTYKY